MKRFIRNSIRAVVKTESMKKRTQELLAYTDFATTDIDLVKCGISGTIRQARGKNV